MKSARKKLQDRNNARIKMLQRKTRSSVEEYKEKRRTANSTCKNKKRKWENEKLLQIQANFEEHHSHKYYKEVKKVRAGFQPRLNFCKDKEGNLITRKDKIMDSWVEHFSELLNKGTLVEEEGEENESIEIRNIEEEIIPPPTLMEVRDQIMILKKTKAPGDDNITAEMMQERKW
jgi:coenzyme F420-reducing hydrogenase alpha subunit